MRTDFWFVAVMLNVGQIKKIGVEGLYSQALRSFR